MSIREQSEILSLNRSSLYYQAKPEFDEQDLRILHRMDKIFTDCPFYGHRRVWQDLLQEKYEIGRDRVLRYMHVLGLEPFYPKKKTSIPDKEHKIYPYLLRDLEITRPNQVWSADITYLRLEHGFCYFVAVIDWYSRYILSYRFSNTLDSDFCIAALTEALQGYPAPEIFNTDQGCQFTSEKFTNILLDHGIKISMDSTGRALDNVIIERFFRTLKYEHVYLQESQTMLELKESVADYLKFYNYRRKHSTHDYQTPYDVYYQESQVINIKASKEDKLDHDHYCGLKMGSVRKEKVGREEYSISVSRRKCVGFSGKKWS